MKLSDKQKAFLKKLAVWLLRITGWWLLLSLLWISQGFIYQKQLELKGPADFVGHEFVIYTTYGDDFFYTNPAGMIIRAIQLLLLIGSIVLATSLLTAWSVHKAKLFKKMKLIDKWLISGLLYAMVAIVFTATDCSSAYTVSGKFYAKVRECQTIADYEKLCGKAVLQKTVNENDSEFIKAIAWFNQSGFKSGRELHIFKYSKPEVYLLIWSENGKIVHRDWCHQSAVKGNKTLLPWGCDFYIDKTGECYIRNPQGDIVFYAQKESSVQVAKSAADAEVARYLNCFKTPIEIKKREDNFQCGGWQGTYLQIVVPARKTVLNTFILASDNMMIFLSGTENFTEMELAELLNQINPAPIYEHFQGGIYSLNVQISPDKSLRLKLDLPRKDLFSQAEINYFQSNPRELAVLLSLCHLIRKVPEEVSLIRKVPEEFSRSACVVFITDLNQSKKLNKAEVIFDAVKRIFNKFRYGFIYRIDDKPYLLGPGAIWIDVSTGSDKFDFCGYVSWPHSKETRKGYKVSFKFEDRDGTLYLTLIQSENK